MAVDMIFKYSKRFRYAPSFNNIFFQFYRCNLQNVYWFCPWKMETPSEFKKILISACCLDSELQHLTSGFLKRWQKFEKSPTEWDSVNFQILWPFSFLQWFNFKKHTLMLVFFSASYKGRWQSYCECFFPCDSLDYFTFWNRVV